MAFLRIDRRRVAAAKGRKRASLQAEADAWIEQRKAATRSRSVELLGKTFATKKKAAEYAKRLMDDSFLCSNMGPSIRFQRLMEGTKPIERTRSGRLGISRDAKPVDNVEYDGNVKDKQRKFTPAKAGHCYRVRQVNGIWRRYVQASSEGGWRWVSDHACQDDALARRKPLNAPE